jgi:protein TonB
MHAAYGQRFLGEESEATWHASFPEPRPDIILAPPPPAAILPPARFGERQGPNWIAIAFILGAHAVLLFALIKFDVIAISKPKSRPLVVELLKMPPPPPPASPMEQKVAPPEQTIAPKIVSPPPIVVTPAPAPQIVVTRDPPAPKAIIVAPAAPAATGPVSVDDLSSKMISAPPPRYPVESRRRKEQGTVFVSVLVGTDGSVSEVGISRSSGSTRLDKVALEAVRRWRWSPVVRGGVAVMVRGIVDVSFTL